MKNKTFNFLLFFFLGFIIVFFLILIIELFGYLNFTTTKNLNFSRIFWSIRLTITTATISSLIATFFAIPIGYLLSRYSFPLKNFISSLLYLPIIISPIALGAMLLIFFNTPIGTFFEKYFFRVVFEVPAIVFAQFVIIIGMCINLTKSVFDYINPEYENISKTLGATSFQTFFYITLPMAKKGIISAFLLTWARAMGEFGATVTLAGATTFKTETLPVAIYLSFASAEISTGITFILITLFIGMTILIILHSLNNKLFYDKNT